MDNWSFANQAFVIREANGRTALRTMSMSETKPDGIAAKHIACVCKTSHGVCGTVGERGMDDSRPDDTTQRPATASDVARLAGVSQSAVSRTFTEGASVSDRTRDKVLEAAGELGYRPNLIARSLITRRSNIVGVVVGTLENQFYPQMLQALSVQLQAAGLRILLFTSDPSRDADPILEEVLNYRVDALILASTSLSSRLAEECRSVGVPVVLVNRTTLAPSVASVTGDNEGGARAIAAFLLAGGHRRFAYVAGLENSSTSREREGAFTAALAESGLPAPVRARGGYTSAKAADAARTLLSAREPPDAIFCANDHMAFAVMDVAREEFGLEIGRSLSVVGFDDIAAASWPSFKLTSFAQPIPAMVREVVSFVRQLVQLPDEAPRRVVVPGALIVRASARLPSYGLRDEDGRRVWRFESGS